MTDTNTTPPTSLANPRRVTLANVRSHEELHELARRAKAEHETPFTDDELRAS